MSTIETMTAGYAAVAKRPWVILPPALLDLFLWLGPDLTAAPVVNRVLRAYLEVEPTGELTAQIQEFAQRAGTVNAFVLVAWQLPSIILAHAGDPIASIGRAGDLAIGSSGGLIAVFFGLLVLGLLFVGVYLAGIAEVVDGAGGVGLAGFWRRLWPSVGRLLLFSALIGGVGLLAGMPLLVVVTVLQQLSPELASFIGTLLAVAVIWAWLYLFFATAAIFLRNRGPVGAIRDSVGVVSRQFWPALWLFLLVQIISLGTSIAWTPVLAHPAGVLAAIVGNAFIATGLAAAWMIFFQERAGTLAAVAAERAQSRR